MTSARLSSSDQRLRPHRHRPRHHAVRRGRRRLREDDRAGRSSGRAVIGGAVELRQIAAITFTEKAGAELRDRARRELQERAAGPAGLEADRCRTALAQLDGAAIGTLHSFAQRLLSEHPVEAQLPPRVEVLDEVSSAVAFDRRWARILDQLLDDPALERTILLLHAANVDPAKLRSLALAFEGSWDLVDDLVPQDAPATIDRRPDARGPLRAGGPRRARRALHRRVRPAPPRRRSVRRLRPSGRRRRRRPRAARGHPLPGPGLPPQRGQGHVLAAARTRCTPSSRR